MTTAVTARLYAHGRISPDETTVTVITGNGLKTTDAVSGQYAQERAVRPRLAEFDEYLRELDGAVAQQLQGGLADPTRRAILARLALGETSVKDLARPIPMSLPTVLKHLAILERGGIVHSEKRGRVHEIRHVGFAIAMIAGM